MKTFYYQIILFIILIFNSCSVSPDFEDSGNTNIDDSTLLEIEQLDIPSNFEFNTHKQVNLTINDVKSNVRYDVYAYSDIKYFSGTETFIDEGGETVTEDVYDNDNLNRLLFSSVPFNGVINQTISIPEYYNQLYILRSDKLKYSSAVVDITNNEVNFNSTSLTSRNSSVKGAIDVLYGVNGDAELFQIDPRTGELTVLSQMPQGSWTCAIDQANKVLYSIGKKGPYPLMKYLIEQNTWETVGNVSRVGDKLDYNQNDGLLYYSGLKKIYSVNPINGDVISTWQVYGLDDKDGGDIAFSSDGTLYMCTYGGLYRLELDNKGKYESIRISAENLPFEPTSITFDSNQELWMATSDANADLVVMNVQSGEWEYRYGKNSNSNVDFGRAINDLSSFEISAINQAETDVDNDGVIDSDDVFPNDSGRAFKIYTPSKTGYGTLVFEDLWPSVGDYDFNDLSLNYQAVTTLNSQNLAVQVDFFVTVNNIGASYTNGFGIELENISPSQVLSVSGTVLNQGFINVSSNGTESNQENAVVVLFDNAQSVLNQQLTVSIKFSQPLSTGDLGVAPFNPFLIINKVREKEVHLPNRRPTSLGNPNYQISGTNKDPDGNYLSPEGLPWAISVTHEIKVPKEKVQINKAYKHFGKWASSNGKNYQDWFKDYDGYIDSDLIQY